MAVRIRSTWSSATLVITFRLWVLSLCIRSSERRYSVSDTTNGRVGFARTAYTEATTN